MNETDPDLIAYERLKALDQERQRLVGRFEMARKDSPEQSNIAKQIYACDEDIDRILGPTPQQQEQTLARIRAAVSRERQKRVGVETEKADQEAGINDVTKGLGCLLIAGLVTLITYFAAEPGDSYYILWGGMAWGAWMVIRGILRTNARS